MKLRYQMRGLGIGIIITALLMGVATGKGIPLSDAEIRAKALELGMVESDSLKLTDIANLSSGVEDDASFPAEPSEENGMVRESEGFDGNGSVGRTEDSDGSGAAGGSDGLGGNGTAGESEGSVGNGAAGDSDGSGGNMDSAVTSSLGGQTEGTEPDRETPEGESTVTIVIEFGVTSYHVSEVLAEAGLIEDAAAFDDYLCSNGFSRKITAGTYEIKPGTSEEEIINIITKNR